MTEGYVFSGRHKQKWKKVSPTKGAGYVILVAVLVLSIWLLLYLLETRGV